MNLPAVTAFQARHHYEDGSIGVVLVEPVEETENENGHIMLKNSLGDDWIRINSACQAAELITSLELAAKQLLWDPLDEYR